jgi:hypothetical protein
MTAAEPHDSMRRVAKESRGPTKWVVATFILLVLLLALVLWAALAPRLIKGVHPDAREGKPTAGEVDREVHEFARSQGVVSNVRCHQERVYVWSCTVLFVGGRVDVVSGVWHPSQDVLGVSVVHRIKR